MLSPIKAAVLGHPISHSLSPRLHGYWLQEKEINGRYEAIDTPPERLAATLQQLAAQGYAGVNLTVPLKEAVLPLLDEVDETARAIGAANLVIFTHGRMRGYNTDAYGFVENLRQALALQSKKLEDYTRHAVLLGAGGAARAVMAGLIEAGVKRVTLSNRSRSKAERLAEDFQKFASSHAPAQGDSSLNIQVMDWQKREQALEDASLLVNSTALGMQGKPPLQIELAGLPGDALVTDIVYQPLQTQLLQQASARGNLTVDGLGMLLYQAQPAFEKFFGPLPQVTQALRDAILYSVWH
jgi:shikimate dehydrogenase